MFCTHIVQFGGQKGFQHFNVPVSGHSYCCTTFLKEVRADHTKFGNCTPNSYARRVERLFLEFTRVTFSPVAKIRLVYGSTDMEVSLIATQKNSCSTDMEVSLIATQKNSCSTDMEVSLIATQKNSCSTDMEVSLIATQKNSCSTDMEVSLIATQKNSCSGNLFKNFRTYGSAVGMIFLT